MFVARRLACAVLAAWSLAATATAQFVAPASERLSLEVLVQQVLDAHPEMVVAEDRHAAALERPAQERALPDPMVSTGYSSTGRPWPGAGLGTDPNAGFGVMVSQALPYPGKRDARAEVMRREAAVERVELDAARLSLTARATQAYVRLAAAWQLDAVLRANEDLLSTLVKVSEARYAVGQAAQQDVIRAQTQVSLIALQRARVQRERRTREGELNALRGRAADAPVARPVDLEPRLWTATVDGLVQAASSVSPMVRRDQLMAARTEAALDVARREGRPDFAVSAGYTFMGSMPDMFEARFDVVVPLQKARRRAMVAERERSLDAERHALEATRRTLQGRIQEDWQMGATAAELATLYRDAVLPQARLALESSIASYQTGGVDFLSVLTNFGSVLEYEMSYVEQLADLHLAASRLEEMTATPLR
ncbi:PTS cellobiose transporter subunit IIC [Luteitalea sp. TBR-22]|uniref:TolC family protein n=1 Tax=Luteitalea sp. TBR-22 TaxID=2802971 RepID=UPI001AF8CDA6|nr:TolC family protein [Luteitalea sp. TBR-22]BCS32517.1 PTS cellobiose transporter subunit IIC [Luteitalea sp. TBR-22]